MLHINPAAVYGIYSERNKKGFHPGILWKLIYFRKQKLILIEKQFTRAFY